ncbi:hypothetical protein AVEN_133147-1 [Araneus ventricosus]|uniref:Uncharacterized protein n=1 Tax=Araneus ventricosus TaxID=182803 RepID=A0A4Y2K9C5_ARAVE|nr:hypothetical protein AVEN_133147-1 [Araneus ventricosus]
MKLCHAINKGPPTNEKVLDCGSNETQAESSNSTEEDLSKSIDTKRRAMPSEIDGLAFSVAAEIHAFVRKGLRPNFRNFSESFLEDD